MSLSRFKWTLSALALVTSGFVPGHVSAGCLICDPFLHCISSYPGARVCLEGPASCAMLMPCLAGPGGRVFDAAGGEDLTTWTLLDAEPAPGSVRASLRPQAGELAVGEDARASLREPTLGGALADVALVHGREFDIVIADAAGDGFALRRAEQGERAWVEVREVRGEVVGALLASESLGERDRLTVPVRVEGRDRVLILQTASVRGGGAALELARLRRALLAAGRTLPQRQEPMLRARVR